MVNFRQAHVIDRELAVQQPEQVVDIAHWDVYEGYEVYPEGARDKSLRICPDPSPFEFCLPNHFYLFKEAIKSAQKSDEPRHPDQYWAEIIAFKIGRLMSLQVPPAFVARNSETGEPGIISEWFLDYDKCGDERRTDGGDHMQALITGYDREKGHQHNLKTVLKFSRALYQQGFLTHSWRDYWGLCLCFDALIGNTDRHQENWGVIWKDNDQNASLTPYFDNGTSLGHELYSGKIQLYLNQSNALDAYINRGRHHMKWSQDCDQRMGLMNGVKAYCEKYPSVVPLLRERLSQWQAEDLEQLLQQLTEFDIKAPFTQERAEFVYILTMERRERLLSVLET